MPDSKTLTSWTDGLTKAVQAKVTKAFAKATEALDRETVAWLATAQALEDAWTVLKGDKARFMLAVEAFGLACGPKDAYDRVQSARAYRMVTETVVTDGKALLTEAEIHEARMGRRAFGALGRFAKAYDQAEEGAKGDKARNQARSNVTKAVTKAKRDGLTYEAVTKAVQATVGTASQASNRDEAKVDRIGRKIRDDVTTLVTEAVAVRAESDLIDTVYFAIAEALMRFAKHGPSAGTAVQAMREARIAKAETDKAEAEKAEADTKAKAKRDKAEADPDAAKADAVATVLTAVERRQAKRQAEADRKAAEHIAKAEAEAEAKAAEAKAKRSEAARKAAATRKANQAAAKASPPQAEAK